MEYQCREECIYFLGEDGCGCKDFDETIDLSNDSFEEIAVTLCPMYKTN